MWQRFFHSGKEKKVLFLKIEREGEGEGGMEGRRVGGQLALIKLNKQEK